MVSARISQNLLDTSIVIHKWAEPCCIDWKKTTHWKWQHTTGPYFDIWFCELKALYNFAPWGIHPIWLVSYKVAQPPTSSVDWLSSTCWVLQEANAWTLMVLFWCLESNTVGCSSPWAHFFWGKSWTWRRGSGWKLAWVKKIRHINREWNRTGEGKKRYDKHEVFFEASSWHWKYIESWPEDLGEFFESEFAILDHSLRSKTHVILNAMPKMCQAFLVSLGVTYHIVNSRPRISYLKVHSPWFTCLGEF